MVSVKSQCVCLKDSIAGKKKKGRYPHGKKGETETGLRFVYIVYEHADTQNIYIWHMLSIMSSCVECITCYNALYL